MRAGRKPTERDSFLARPIGGRQTCGLSLHHTLKDSETERGTRERARVRKRERACVRGREKADVRERERVRARAVLLADVYSPAERKSVRRD